MRVYSGVLASGASLWNPRVSKFEKVARILRMHAESGVAQERALPGEIVALTGLKHTATGDTLCTKDEAILLEPLSMPEPVISLVIEPSESSERDKLRAALGRLAHEDPTFHVREDSETGQWLIAGMGELHLEVAQHRLANEFHVRARTGAPRVAYREAPTQRVRASAQVEKTLGTKEIFGALEVELVPALDLVTPRVEWSPTVLMQAAFHKAVHETLVLDLQVGPRFGFPLTQCTVRVLGSKSDPRRDAEPAFVQAADQALKQALDDAAVVLLEPWMAFEVQTPAEFSSGILADLNSRHAELTEVEAEGLFRTLRGTVALSKMFGYSTAVRSLSQGRAGFSMLPAAYRAVPEGELEARGLVWH